ncbi:MAG: thymidine phosphorylase [Deltaproteobacteria bacterium]|nr:MAG: thymidine phosphorylase [Deltaproteobacteria bacterium]
MRAVDIIRHKRDGEVLSESEIATFIAGYTDGRIPDYQAAALAMAIYFRGLSPAELAAWTDAMLHSGEVLDLSEIPGPKVDKHSTGGVGDKVSLCLAPIVAACGVRVPMVSGRGLGHTGGTLDKLEAIPGFRVDLSVEAFRRQVRELGVCLIGQTESIAPADKKLYALRDVTATVESIPLIASSILSKKLAEGIDGLVLDVKVGRGAFMKTREDARRLAETMVRLGTDLGVRVVALLTDMEQPLGWAVGNALETAEALDVLDGGGPPDLVELTLDLAAEMLLLGGVATAREEALARAREAIASGAARECMRRLIAAQGGDARVIDDRSVMAAAPVRFEVSAERDGYVAALDAERIGRTAMELGAGRARKEDPVDPAVGLVLKRKVGDAVAAGETLCVVHAPEQVDREAVAAAVREAYAVREAAPPPRPLILERVREDGTESS